MIRSARFDEGSAIRDMGFMPLIFTSVERRPTGLPAGAAFWATLVLALACAGCTADPREALFPERPNVIVVMIDALRRDHLGVYGYDQPTSPFLDRLAADSFVFDLAFSQASETSVSTSTLLTSRFFPYEAGSKGGQYPAYTIAQGNTTVAEVFADSGYDTVGVFTNPHHFPGSGYWQGFAEPLYIKPNDTGVFTPHPYGQAPEVVTKFTDWLDRREPESESPFFAYLHFMDVHNPYEPPRELEDQFVTARGRRGLYMNGKPEGDRVPTADDLSHLRARYDAGIRFLDGEIEKLVAEIEQRGLLGGTVVVVTSDHGDEFMEHGGLGHNQTLEKEMVAIPMFIHAASAAGRGPGRRIPALVRNLDLAPTMLEIAGIEVPAEFQGRSLVPLISDRRQAARGAQHSFAWYGDWRSVTTREWHFVWNMQTKEHRLYDNRTDPRGLDDAAASHPDVVEGFRALIERYGEEHARSYQISKTLQESGDTSAAEMSPEIIEQLKALGYLAD
ncbi:MAG: sulfatase [bacterium]|nr:sulfatase [bacterium]